MNIFTKYLLKSISEKKGRTFLILCSITVSTALLVASLGSAESILQNTINQYKEAYGTFNVSIQPNEKSKEATISTSDFNADGINDMCKITSIGSSLNGSSDKQINLCGMSLGDFEKFNNIKLLKQADLNPFDGNKIIISQKTSETLNKNIGDTLNLCILGQYKDFKISAIASNNGLFFTDTPKHFLFVTPDKNITQFYGQDNKYTSIYAAVKDITLDTWINNFNNDNKTANISATILVDKTQIEAGVNDIKVPLLFMLSIVLLMTVFIIYSSFKLIITERLPVIGTFLSQGADKFDIVILFLKESFIYAFISGIIGDILGAGIIYITSYIFNPLKDYGVNPSIQFYPKYFISGFIFSLVISLVSSILPILSIRKMPVKTVILNSISSAENIPFKNFIFGILLLLLSIIMHLVGPHIQSPRPYITAIPAFFCAILGVILIIPKLIDILLYPIVKVLRKWNCVAMLSLNNIRTSKLLINNIRLITVSIVAIMMVMSLKTSIADMLLGVYTDINYDFNVSSNSDNVSTLKLFNNIMENYTDKKNVTKLTKMMTFLNGDSSKEIDLVCTDPDSYKNYDSYMSYEDKNTQLNELSNDDDGIIISTKIATRYHIKKGDTILLKADDNKEPFKVISIADAKLMNMGNVNLISLNGAKKHFNINYLSSYRFTSNLSTAEVKKTLNEKLKGLDVEISTKQDAINNDEQNTKQIINTLSAFSYITMIIGAFGILSNVSISFIQRKRLLAILSSTGLTDGGRVCIIFAESVLQAVIGTTVSLIASIWIIYLLKDIFKYLVLNMDFKYPFSYVGIVIIASTLLMLITTIPSMLKSRKLVLVNELKYE